MRTIIFILLLTTSILGLAETPANISTQIQQLKSELVRVQQESQSTFQQFQMIQELRRNEVQNAPMTTLSRTPGASVPAPNYDDMVQNRQAKETRITKYTTELDSLYVYYKELEEKRRSLVAEIDLLKPGSYQEE